METIFSILKTIGILILIVLVIAICLPFIVPIVVSIILMRSGVSALEEEFEKKLKSLQDTVERLSNKIHQSYDYD